MLFTCGFAAGEEPVLSYEMVVQQECKYSQAQ